MPFITSTHLIRVVNNLFALIIMLISNKRYDSQKKEKNQFKISACQSKHVNS